MSNPYGNDPYGQQPPNPYGGAPGGGFNQPPKTDGVSIAALVFSFCCSPVALVLGIVGIVRTKDGKRKGRWAAVIGVVLGVLGLIGGIVAIAAGGLFLNSVVTPDEAEAGQCIDIDEDGNEVLFREAECNEEHDAEIVAVVEVTDDNLEQIESQMVGFCVQEISEDDFAKIEEHIGGIDDLKAVTEDPNDVEVDDHLVCYVEPDDKLDEQIL